MNRIALSGMSVLLVFAAFGCSKELGVKEIVPKIGVTTGGEPVEIHGSGFHTGMGITVLVGPQKADNVAIRSEDTLTFTTPSSPAGETTVDIRIILDSGEEFLMAKAFTYVEPASAGMDIRQLGSRQSQRQKQ